MSLGKYVNLLRGLESPSDAFSTSQLYFMLELMRVQGGSNSDLIDHLIALATADGDSEALAALNAAKSVAQNAGIAEVSGATDAQTVSTIMKRDALGATSIACKSGITSSRPVVTTVGYMFFDTTLGKPIWWNGSIWVLATGIAA